MEMTNLKLLHRSMMDQDLETQRFRVKLGATEFDCLFVGQQPRPLLALATRDPNPKVFRFEVKRGYKIDAYLGDRYEDMRDLYFGRGKSARKLQSRDLFEELHAAIPTEATDGMVPEPDQIARILDADTP